MKALWGERMGVGADMVEVVAAVKAGCEGAVKEDEEVGLMEAAKLEAGALVEAGAFLERVAR